MSCITLQANRIKDNIKLKVNNGNKCSIKVNKFLHSIFKINTILSIINGKVNLINSKLLVKATPITGKSTDLIEIGFTITSRSSTNWCWLIGYYTNESDRFGIYPRRNSENTFTIDFWRGNSGSSRKYSTLVSTVNKRFDLVVGNPSLTATNQGYAYDIASKTTLIASGTAINTTTSSLKYTVSENRSGKANNRVRYYYVKIYKQANGVKTLVLDWIPVQRISDSVWGFYDRITHNFYPSKGSEQFTGE